MISEGRRGLIQSFTEHSVADTSDETAHKVCTTHTHCTQATYVWMWMAQNRKHGKVGSWPHKNCEEMCTSQLLPLQGVPHTYIHTYVQYRDSHHCFLKYSVARKKTGACTTNRRW